jgi:hypothetical protein
MDAPTISYNGYQLTSSPADSYQWYIEGSLIPGATDQIYAPIQNGNYSVRAGFGAPCLLMSDTLSVMNVSVPESVLPPPVVYPQPANGQLHLQLGGGPRSVTTIRLFDAVGRSVLSGQWLPGNEFLDLQVADLAEGAYLLRGTGRNGILLNRKVMIVH